VVVHDLDLPGVALPALNPATCFAEVPWQIVQADDDAAIAGPGRRGLLPRSLILIAAMAAVPRLAGLGHISLWLDEILGTLQTSGTLAEAWQALKLDQVHPPLWGLVNWLTQRATDSEPLRRLVPVAFGVATVVLLADFVARRFGRTTAVLAAVIAAFSPFHVRFSQELRPYSLGLMLLVLSLWLIARAVEHGKPRDWILVGVALWAGLGTLYLVAVGLLPALAIVIGSGKPGAQLRGDLGKFVVVVAGAGIAFGPWIAVLGEALSRAHEASATHWTLDLAASRWHFLTSAANDGDHATWVSLIFAIVAMFGSWRCTKKSAAWVALVGAAAGSAGVELLLASTNHWSNGRYSAMAWPFIVMMLAAGCQQISDLAISWKSSKAPLRKWLVGLGALLPVTALTAAEGLGLLGYFDSGRPDWLSVARDASRVASPTRTILVGNDWTRISLGYYVARLEPGGRPALSSRVRIAGPSSLRGTGEPCAALVVAWYPERPELEELIRSSPAQKRYARSGARLLALAPPSGEEGSEPWRCFPLAMEAGDVERVANVWGIPLRRPSHRARLDMEEVDAPQLLFGWSFPEKSGVDVSFRWAVGHWASVRLPTVTGRLRLRVWSYAEGQRLTLYRDRRPVAELSLSPKAAESELEWPANGDGGESEVVYFHFAATAPVERVGRPLAAGFDRIEIVP
jgi:hypothetical protein